MMEKNVKFEKVILFYGSSRNFRVQALKITYVVLLPPQKINSVRCNDSLKLIEKEQKKNTRSVNSIDDHSLIKGWFISRKVGDHFSDIEKIII